MRDWRSMFMLMENQTTFDRFIGKVPDYGGDGCWEWAGARDGFQKYGTMMRLGWGSQFLSRGKSAMAHRVSWELHYGALPPRMLVLHSCDNPPCVRPDHLFLGTQAQNMADMRAKGRAGQKKMDFCHWGHPLSGENLTISPNGQRHCRVCRKRRWAEWSKKNRRVGAGGKKTVPREGEK